MPGRRLVVGCAVQGIILCLLLAAPGSVEGGLSQAGGDLYVFGNAAGGIRADRFAYRERRLVRGGGFRVDLRRFPFPEQRVSVARLSPSHRWLAIGTGADPIEVEP